MSFTRQGAVALLVAFAALVAMVTSASAAHLSISSTKLRIIYRSIIFKNSINTARLLCPLTLEGTLHSSTITKTTGSLIGYITRLTLRGGEAAGECTGGAVTILTASLPWHITYEAFRGVLPAIEALHILLINPKFQVHLAGSLTCLAASEPRHALKFWLIRGSNGSITGEEPEEGSRLPLTGEGGLCSFGTGFFGAEEKGTVTTETGGGVSITLI